MNRLPLRRARSMALGLLLITGCAGGKNAGSQGARIRYEPPPELPDYEVEEHKDPIEALEALEIPENPPPPQEASGGGASEEAPPSGGFETQPAADGGGATVDEPETLR